MASVDVFMDTAGFLALWDTSDEHHERAIRLQSELVQKKRRLNTLRRGPSSRTESAPPNSSAITFPILKPQMPSPENLPGWSRKMMTA
jgi:hypothetical protein